MVIFLSIISTILFILCITLFLFIRALTKASENYIKNMEDMLEEYMKTDEENLKSMENLLEIFSDFIRISKIIGSKYDLVQYADYTMFLSKLYQIETILQNILGPQSKIVEKNNGEQ
ncbi:MAG: hypothetical protein N3A54_03010 [Patescibacteria group bacterium]|nr:hypothetical protein [Patescibacteria group bacterium]